MPDADCHFVMSCDTIGCDRGDETEVHLDIHEVNKEKYELFSLFPSSCS